MDISKSMVSRKEHKSDSTLNKVVELEEEHDKTTKNLYQIHVHNSPDEQRFEFLANQEPSENNQNSLNVLNHIQLNDYELQSERR